MNLKQMLLGNRIGDLAMLARGKAELFSTAFFSHAETVGTLANDQISVALIASLCNDGETFLDVGAHIGSVMAAVRSCNPSVEVIGIEAIPAKAERLRRKFPNAKVHSCAVGEVQGSSSFFVDTRRSGYSSLISSGGNAKNVKEIIVDIERLDDLIPPHVTINVIKMDIEGAELGALRGGSDLLARCRPHIMFESAPERPGSRYPKRELFRYFQARDYLIVIPNRVAHNDDGLTEAGFLESHLYPRRTTNFFAMHKDRRIEIRDRARQCLNICAR